MAPGQREIADDLHCPPPIARPRVRTRDPGRGRVGGLAADDNGNIWVDAVDRLDRRFHRREGASCSYTNADGHQTRGPCGGAGKGLGRHISAKLQAAEPFQAHQVGDNRDGQRMMLSERGAEHDGAAAARAAGTWRPAEPPAGRR